MTSYRFQNVNMTTSYAHKCCWNIIANKLRR